MVKTLGYVLELHSPAADEYRDQCWAKCDFNELGNGFSYYPHLKIHHSIYKVLIFFLESHLLMMRFLVLDIARQGVDLLKNGIINFSSYLREIPSDRCLNLPSPNTISTTPRRRISILELCSYSPIVLIVTPPR
jgi:hypothetical protein